MLARKMRKSLCKKEIIRKTFKAGKSEGKKVSGTGRNLSRTGRDEKHFYGEQLTQQLRLIF